MARFATDPAATDPAATDPPSDIAPSDAAPSARPTSVLATPRPLPGAHDGAPLEAGAHDGAPLEAGALVAASNEALATLATSLDPACLSGPDAASLYASLCAGARRVVALKALLASRIDTSGCFADAGWATASAYLASLEGTSDAEARRTLGAGRALASLPGVEEAARDGKLSAPKLVEVTEVAAEHPEAEGELLGAIEERSLAEVRARSRAVRHRHPDADARARMSRIWRGRFFRHTEDGDGAFCFRGRDTPERGARLLALLEAEATALGTEEQITDPGGERTPPPARRADALFGLATGTALTTRPAGPLPEDHPDDGPFEDGDPEDGPPDGERAAPGPAPTIPRCPHHPPATLLVRVDLEALRRGQILPGEVCDLEGMGPIPLPMAKDLGNDALLRLIFHRAGDIRAVVHYTRTINATLRTALEARDPTCVVPGCTMARNLEIDHVVPYGGGGATSLANLARLCRRHHFQKTYEGWTLARTNPDRDEAPTWAFTPMPPFGEEPGNRDEEGERPSRE